MFDRQRPRERGDEGAARPPATPPLAASAIVALQRTAGNAAVARMLDANPTDYYVALRGGAPEEDTVEGVGALFAQAEEGAERAEADAATEGVGHMFARADAAAEQRERLEARRARRPSARATGARSRRWRGRASAPGGTASTTTRPPRRRTRRRPGRTAAAR
jgi:hypothetical protein